jgi:CPA1 family monovalent cation:H+ antiporter
MALGFNLSYLWCLVFGALISPTDPIAVMSVLKTVRVPADLEAKIAGESLFNDGAGIVSFSILLAAAVGAQEFSASRAMELFVFEAGGGALLGFVAGWLAYRVMRSIDDLNLGLLVTLALVMGGFALSHVLHVSGPVAMAVAGLFIGNRGTHFAMSASVRARVTGFWELVDQILNSILFLLIGLEVVSVDGDWRHILVGTAAIILVLIGRALSVWLPMSVLERSGPFSSGSLPILVWGGVRGGISVALALSIPDHAAGNTILTATYLVVVFSVVVQGSTIRHAVNHFAPSKRRSAA